MLLKLKRSIFFSAVLALCFLFSIAEKTTSQTTYVPLNHWVYQYLERQETKHIFRHGMLSSRPLTRVQVAGYLAEIHQWLKKGNELSQVEQKQLNFLNNEFREELTQFIEHSIEYETRLGKLLKNNYVKKYLPRIIYKNQRNALSWSVDNFRVFADPIIYRQAAYTDADTADALVKHCWATNGVRLRGSIGNYMGFYVDARDTKEWGTKKYKLGNYTLPGLGFVRATSPDYIYHDETDAYLSFNYKYVGLVYGKFKNYWGPACQGSLILSDYATSYDQFKLELNFSRFRFTSIYAFLIDFHENVDDILQEKKYFAAHRLEVAPYKWLNIGLSESVMFKGRSFEPAYLNPIMFFRSAEHYLGSPDNMMMGFDFKLNAVKNMAIYGELLIDDVMTTRLGADWYGNKLAYTAGLFFVDPLTLPNTDFRVEYTRIRPYVYTHRDGVNYEHYATRLGHWLRPNSDNVYLELNWQLSRHARISVYSRFLRHGANSAEKNVGGDSDRAHGEGDSKYVTFLDGNLETQKSFGLKWSYELFRCLFLTFDFMTISNDLSLLDGSKNSSNLKYYTLSLGFNY